MIATDFLPYNFVEGVGFKNLMAIACKDFVVPSRTTFSRNHIPQLYKTTADRVKKIIRDDFDKGQFSVTPQFVNKNFIRLIIYCRGNKASVTDNGRMDLKNWHAVFIAYSALYRPRIQT